jgi:SAM-dependent methyltransferase
MDQATSVYYKREFWADEGCKYQKPHFRLTKAAGLVNRVANGRECDLLDVGCGPAALMHLLDPAIRYHGIDIAIQQPSPQFIETDFVLNPIKFNSKQFDIIVAQGVFEYLGTLQDQKLAEIRGLLRVGGTLIATYVNFDHCNKNIYWPYNNVQSLSSFQSSVSQYFNICRQFPTSYRWHHDEPRGRIVSALQKQVNVNIPVLSRMFGVEYFFICKREVSEICLDASVDVSG